MITSLGPSRVTERLISFHVGAIFRSKPKRGKTVALAAACLLRRINGWPGEILRFYEENVVPVRIRTHLNSFVSMQHPKWVQ